MQWENRAHFFGIAARLMRMILVDHARAHHAAKRGGAAAAVTLDDCMAVSPGRAPDVLEIDEALDRLAEVDERKAKVIEMRYFGGMDREEVATALGLTVSTVKRDLRLGRGLAAEVSGGLENPTAVPPAWSALPGRRRSRPNVAGLVRRIFPQPWLSK